MCWRLCPAAAEEYSICLLHLRLIYIEIVLISESENLVIIPRTILDIKWNFRRNQHKEYKPGDQWKPKLKLFSSNESLQILLENCLLTMSFRLVSVSMNQRSSQWWPETWEKEPEIRRSRMIVTGEGTARTSSSPLASSWDCKSYLSSQTFGKNKPGNRAAKKPPQRNEVKLRECQTRKSIIPTEPSVWRIYSFMFSYGGFSRI